MTILADKILEYLKTYGDKRIKSFFYGDPLILAASNLPAIIVENKNTNITHGATGMDEMNAVFSIKLVMSKKDELGKNPEEVSLQRTMADILMQRDTNNNWEETSIIGILRKYFTLGETIENQEIVIEYFVAERGELITEEAELLITIKDFINVPNRA
jgi:MarR-like DNA-binding transcriptional regulator SgrR of sgrS sRNA